MRRAPLARRRPLPPRRAEARRSERVADRAYMGAVHRLPCCARHLSLCSGPIEADHAGIRPLGRKADDATCISLCRLHHRQRHDFGGPFLLWDRHIMRQWLDEQIAATQRELARAGMGVDR